MSELYKAIAGSPITYLAGDISAGQTTIAVADDSALPDAPNICTIGYGENIETIRYGAKSNGVLQNVTRGLEGTPRAWKAGTEVARFFTAYDYNALIENFNSHLAESSSKHITGSGSNANGSYIKFDDGTMICSISKTVTASIDVAYGSIYQGTYRWDYPEPFVDIPAVSCSEFKWGNSASWGSVTAESPAYANLRGLDLYSRASGNTSVSAIAIGRWK